MNRTIQVGMPQMALGCLSENWLLKELGDLHWEKLCSALQSQSSKLVDSQGRRLYATFVRIRIQLDGTLRDFPEGDEINLSIDMSRFGRSTVQSAIAIEGTKSSGRANLLTTFSVRAGEGGNSLMKSEPAGEYQDIDAATDVTPFFTEYSTVRSEYGRRISEERPEPSQWYPINPYIDSNGANLLYFAAYQSMADYLVLRQFPDERDVFTKERDIYYFRNSDLTDASYLESVSRERTASGQVQGQNLLFSASDGSCLAFMRTIKEA
jgi:probable biosynthetic protein (TIGR04098 family)